MAVLVHDTVHANKTFAKIHRTAVTKLGAGFALSAELAPAFCDIITSIALGAVGTLFRRAIGAHVAAFLTGAAVADLCAGALDALAALQA